MMQFFDIFIKFTMRKFLSDRDDFGHPITLNYSKRGDHHNTVFGGIVSLTINGFMLLFTLILADQMFAFQRD